MNPRILGLEKGQINIFTGKNTYMKTANELVGEDHYLLEPNDIVKSEDECKFIHCNDQWSQVHSSIGSKAGLRNDLIYRRKNKNSTVERIAALEAEVKALKDRLSPTKACAAEPPCAPSAVKADEFKKGDWLICTNLLPGTSGITIGNLYQVGEERDWFRTVVLKSVGPYTSSQFRRATRDEIEKHLLADAEKRGFKIGAYVMISISFRKKNFKITGLKVWQPGDSKGDLSFGSLDATENSQPFCYAIYMEDCEDRQLPIDKLEIVKEEPIVIKVDGVDYTARFETLHVRFGCTYVLNQVFHQAKAYLDTANSFGQGTGERLPLAIQIGKGLFSRELINRIVDRLNNPQE